MADERKVSEAARALGRLGAAQGGRARAAKLTPEERREIAQQAAAARWGRNPATRLPTAVYGSADRPLRLGDIEIPAYVLDDGRRVLSQRGLQAGVGLSHGGGKLGARRLDYFLASLERKGLDLKGLTVRAVNPITFVPAHGGQPALGYDATILPEICRAILEARRARLLHPNQQKLAQQAEIILAALAEVGIIALVDEATGYQDQRAHDALARILERFIVKELQPYVKTFPPDFYKEIYRLHGWGYPPVQNRHNSNLGKLTNDLVYDRLAPGVRDKLHELTPRAPSGRLKQKLFQRLTPDFGHPKLREHLGAVVMAMKMSQDWKVFMGVANRLLPKYPRVEDKHGQRILPLS